MHVLRKAEEVPHPSPGRRYSERSQSPRARPSGIRSSPHAELLVLDIETTPDRDRLPATWDGSFPKPAYHRVACISYATVSILRAADGTESYRIDRFGSGGEPGWDEARLLSGFWRLFDAGDYRVVTWNGRKFDCAVLRLRALIHGIAVPCWHLRGDKWANYASRWSGWHLDVMEALSDHGATTAMGLDETSAMLGLPGKIGNGAGVEELVSTGRWKALRDYCEVDVLNTYSAYLRWAWYSGLSTAIGHDASVDDLVRRLQDRTGDQSHLGDFLDRWSTRYAGAAKPVGRE